MIHCYVDESIHDSCGFVATSFVFAGESFEKTVQEVLRDAGLSPPSQEFKSSARMDSNSNMQLARNGLLALAGSKAKVAVFFGAFNRATLGKHTLQALQSVVVRNGINPAALSVYCDEEIFPSEKKSSETSWPVSLSPSMQNLSAREFTETLGNPSGRRRRT